MQHLEEQDHFFIWTLPSKGQGTLLDFLQELKRIYEVKYLALHSFFLERYWSLHDQY